MNNNTKTQAQQAAEAYAATLAKKQLRAIKVVSVLAKLVTFGVAGVSYRHQSTTLFDWEAPVELAFVLPALTDLFTIICVLAISTPAIDKRAPYWAKRLIAFPVVLSAGINFAGHGSALVKVVALLLPVFIPLAEFIASLIKPDFAEMDRIERGAYAVVTAEVVSEIDEAAKAARSEAAKKGAEKRRENAKAAAVAHAAKLEARRQKAAVRRAAEAVPVSPAWVIEGRQPNEVELASIAA